VSEHEESAEPDPTIPGLPAGQHQPGPSSKAGARGQRAAKVAGAVTSRTAGWMVAAALAGSLVTLLLDGGTSQTAGGQVAFRDVGRASWRIAATPLTPKQVYVAPGGPLAGGMVAPACAYPGPGMPPRIFRHQRSITIYGRQRIAIGKKGLRVSWTVIGRGPAAKRITVVRPGCQAMPWRCDAAIGVQIGQAPGSKRIMIQRHGRVVLIGPGGRPQRRISVRPKAGQRVTIVVPAAPPGWQSIPSCAVYLPASPAPGH
jgi:hypothetical protein